MAWTDVSFDEVNPGQELIPEGEYTLLLLSAAKGRFDQEAIDVKFSITTEGTQQGATVYLTYPNPDKADKNQPAESPTNWVNKRFKLLLAAVAPYGFNIQHGEHPVDFLNRIVDAADEKGEPILIDGRIGHDKYEDKKTGELVTRHKLALASLKPHAQ